MPEINAGRQETGSGPSTWLASGAMWTQFASMVSEAMAAMTAELAALGINWQGLAPTAMTAAVGPFMAWLATMEATAAINALACFAVAEAFALATGTMIPLPAVTTNRISEMIAEATNFLGVNSGVILALNAQYGDFWGNNGAVMESYDDAVQAATMPTPAMPPPPLASAAGAAGQIGDATAQAAAQSALGASTQATTNAMGDTVSSATEGASSSGSMGNVMSSAGSLLSTPTQAVGQLGSTLSEPMNTLMSPLTSLMTGMGGNTSNAAGFGMGPGSSLASFTGGAGDGASGSGGGMGGGVPIGGGLGGSMLGQNYMGASGGPVRSQPVFNGVSAKPSMVETVAAAGPGPGGAGGSSSSKGRTSDPVYAVPDRPNDEDERI